MLPAAERTLVFETPRLQALLPLPADAWLFQRLWSDPRVMAALQAKPTKIIPLRSKLHMYAMSGKLLAQPGQRKALVKILLRAAEVVAPLPGCRLYIVNEDLNDETAIWVMEIWEDQASHDASLQNVAVRALIVEAMPLMGGPPSGSAMRVVGGHGI